jgi:hypothetical protein
MLVISSLSVEYVHVPVAQTSSGVDIDPTGDIVAMALVPQGTTPAPGDFKTGTWLQDVSTIPVTHLARLLVGPTPGVLTLAPGLFDCWLKITDNPEVPIHKAGPVRVI